MERATGTEVYGCGSPHSTDITLNIQTTTGGNFSISTNGKNTVEHLKKLVSKKLKVAKDRICLLHRERQLRDGTLEENGLLDGSRVILLPSVETGLLSQRPENSVMQALESLNDTQVNDFLSGKSPLNLTMRLGDHMMLIQLQLSTLTTSASSIAQHLRNTTAAKNAMRTKSEPKDTPSAHVTQPKSSTTVKSDKAKQESQKSVLQQQDIDMLQNVLGLNHKVAEEKSAEQPAFNKDKEENDTSNNQLLDLFGAALENEQSPIKSLSNLVSSPIDVTASEGRETALGTSVKNSLIDLLSCNKLAAMATDAIPSTSAMPDKVAPATSHTPDSSISDDSDSFAEQSSFLAESTIDEYPMENLFNNAVDKGLFNEQDESMMDREISNLATTSHGTRESSTGILPSFQSLNEPLKSKRFQYLLHKTSKFKHPIGQNKQKAFMQSVVNKQKKKILNQIDANPQPSTSRTEPYVTSAKKTSQVNEASMEPATPSTSRQTQFKVPDVPKKPYKIVSTAPTVIDTKPNSQPSTSRTEPFVTSAKKSVQVNEASKELATPSTSKQLHFKVPDVPKKPYKIVSTSPPVIDTKALIEASKNLTQKLKKLSKEVLTNKVDIRPAEEAPRAAKVGPGAVIESMKHHGKGIYSGTFSGTLNPALQDRYGRPKRDISTIIHILNDLLCATPPITISQKESKHSCSSSSEESVKCAGCSQPSCSYGQCDGHLPTTSAKPCTCEHKDCQCSRLDPNACASCEEKSTIGETCKKCVMAKTLAMENSKTKCKLEQLRLVMQQKKQRREARKLKTLPYTTTKTIVPPENQTSIQEEIETIG